MTVNGRKYALGGDGLSAYVLSVRRCQTEQILSLLSCFEVQPERIPSHHPHAFADHSRQFTFSSLGNVNVRECSANVRKCLYGGDGALGEQASCLLCLLIHRCQTDFKQISVLHLSNICGQSGGDGTAPRTHTVVSLY